MAKPVTPVSRVTLEAALKEAEVNGALKNLGDLWKAACEIYNKNPNRPSDFGEITPSVVMLRATLKWPELMNDIKTKPGKRGRAAGSATGSTDTVAEPVGMMEDAGDQVEPVDAPVDDPGSKETVTFMCGCGRGTIVLKSDVNRGVCSYECLVCRGSNKWPYGINLRKPEDDAAVEPTEVVA